MGKHGFMPFSAAGVVAVLLVVAMVGHAVWSRHQYATGMIDDITTQTILTVAASIQADLQRLARYAIYEALWDVSKRAGDYGSGATRELAIERLAAEYFNELAGDLPSVYKHHDARIELELSDAMPSFDLRRTSEGYAVARVELPQTRVKVRSWDNALELTLPCENFSVFVDSRYFLLEELMDRFVEGIPKLDDLGSFWWAAEYSTAWSQALSGRVQLSERRTRTFFELAWAKHEFDTFGSSDYLATSARVLGIGGDKIPPPDFSFGAAEIAPPITAAELDAMKGYIDGCIGSIDDAGSELGMIERYVESAMDYARENSENLVRLVLSRALGCVGRARACVQGVSQSFEGLLGYLKEMNNGFAQQLCLGLTESAGSYPVLGDQISAGVRGIESKIAALESSMSDCLQRVVDSSAPLENLLGEFKKKVQASVREMLSTAAPQRRFEYDYPGPEDHVYDPGSEPRPTLREIEVYVIDGSNANLGTLRAILANARKDFERMRNLARIADKAHERSAGVKIDEDLKQKLLRGTGLGFEDPQFREHAYEILPPSPIDAEPGISVFHDFRITGVEYKRRDPLGWVCQAAPPTPIPLWFIGLTLYWAQWEVSLEVEEGAVEEIFDFDNPVILREHLLPWEVGEVVTVHKPLAFRRELPRMRFSFALVIVLPGKNFAIARPETMS